MDYSVRPRPGTVIKHLAFAGVAFKHRNGRVIRRSLTINALAPISPPATLPGSVNRLTPQLRVVISKSFPFHAGRSRAPDKDLPWRVPFNPPHPRAIPAARLPHI